jgi:hypothetical protein
MSARRNLAIVFILLVVASAVMAFFVKPSPDTTPMVDQAAEVSDPELKRTRGARFPARIMQPRLALVLIQSEFSKGNENALEALRSWAKERFSQDWTFLHPVFVRRNEPHQTIFDSMCHNLFAPGRYWLEKRVMKFLRWRINEYQDTNEYQAFRVDFYELFGAETDAALMLCCYQEDRARQAVSIFMAAGCLLSFALVAFAIGVRQGTSTLFSRGRRLLCYGWFALSAFYAVVAWSSNDVACMMATLISSAVAAFLVYPFRISISEDRRLALLPYDLSPRVVAFLTWTSLTLLGIHVLTWIKSGSLVEPDPVTLLFSGLHGDFLHDPDGAKKVLSSVLGVMWLLGSAWMIHIWWRSGDRTRDFDRQIKTLDFNSSLTPEGFETPSEFVEAGNGK